MTINSAVAPVITRQHSCSFDVRHVKSSCSFPAVLLTSNVIICGRKSAVSDFRQTTVNNVCVSSTELASSSSAAARGGAFFLDRSQPFGVPIKQSE